MKKLLFLIVITMMSFNLFAQTSTGGYVVFPDKKLMGLYYKPQLAFGRVNDSDIIVLLMTSPDDYASFDEDSRILIKFEDNSTVKLPICLEMDVEKDYETSWNSSLKKYSHFYQTYSCYNIDDETLKAIVEKGKKIIKIRVVRTNGDINDYDITEKYQPKLIEGLQNSYKQLNIIDKERKENIADEDF